MVKRAHQAGVTHGDLTETMAFDPDSGLAGVDEALARVKAAIPDFDRHDARNELQAATFRLRVPATVRLAVARSGALAIEIAPDLVAPAK